MSYELTVKRGDVAPDVELTVTDENGIAIDLTAATVKFSMAHCRAPDVMLVDDQPGVLVSPTEGKIAYRWQSGETNVAPGTYEGEFTITPAVGDTMQVPTVGKVLIYIQHRTGD